MSVHYSEKLVFLYIDEDTEVPEDIPSISQAYSSSKEFTRMNKDQGIKPLASYRVSDLLEAWGVDKDIKKLQSIIALQDEMIKNLREANEFYASKVSWRYSGDDRFDCNISYQDASEVITGKQRDKVGGKRARLAQSKDQELQKKMEGLNG